MSVGAIAELGVFLLQLVALIYMAGRFSGRQDALEERVANNEKAMADRIERTEGNMKEQLEAIADERTQLGSIQTTLDFLRQEMERVRTRLDHFMDGQPVGKRSIT